MFKTFKGKFEDNIKNGEGTLTLDNDRVIQARWDKDQISDKCKIIYPDRITYDGQHTDYKANG